MSKSRKAQQKLPPHEHALAALRAHYLLGPVAKNVHYRKDNSFSKRFAQMPKSYCQVEGESYVHYNDALKLGVEEWLGVLSLATLVLALGAPKKLAPGEPMSDLAAQLAALHWWSTLKVGRLPEHFEVPAGALQWGRLPLAEIGNRITLDAPEMLDAGWTLTRTPSVRLMLPGPVATVTNHFSSASITINHEEVFAQAMVDNAKRALQAQHDANHEAKPNSNPNSNAAKAKRWLIAHYPLLGSLLTQFDLIEDIDICRRIDVKIAAINVGLGEIYVNPARHLTLEESKFVMAHEVLHAGLCHATRRQGRDRYLWNVACDFVINDWLVQMQVGVPPADGLLYDEELRGWPAEDIYIRLAADLRIRRRLSSFRGGDCDMLDVAPGSFFTDREEFCKRALLQGLDYHQASGRGTLPGGLVEAIRLLNQPPIPWQAKLAEWIQERFPLPERRRTYARPSRRQSATPDEPRPRYVDPEDERTTHTFGVIIDSSGSMEREHLGKALGAVVSYAQAQAVRHVRLVYCDATPYDEGFVPIDALAGHVSVKGRGGTVLQPAIDLLQTRRDFPKDCPILIITDGFCESDLVVAHDHAFLLTPGGELACRTRKPVFRMT